MKMLFLLPILFLMAGLSAQPGTALVLSKGHVAGEQTYVMDAAFPKEKVDGWLEKGYHIQDVSFGDHHWIVTLTDHTSYEDQVYLLTDSPEYPEAFVAAQRDSGLFVTSLAFGAGQWVVACSKVPAYDAQFVQFDSTFSLAWVDSQAPPGFHVSDMAVDLAGCHMVMTKDTSIKDQRFFYGKKYPQEALAAALKDKTYRITHLSYQNNHWLAVLSSGTAINSQEWAVKQSFPKNTIENGWTAGYIVAQFQRFYYGREVPRAEPVLAVKSPITQADKDRCPKISNPGIIQPLAQKLFDVGDEAERLKLAKKLIPDLECCIRVSHVDYLSQLFDQEEHVYGLLELCYEQSYGRDRFASLRKLLKEEKYQKKFDKLVE